MLSALGNSSYRNKSPLERGGRLILLERLESVGHPGLKVCLAW